MLNGVTTPRYRHRKIQLLENFAGKHAQVFEKELRLYMAAFSNSMFLGWDVDVDEVGNLFIVPITPSRVVEIFVPSQARREIVTNTFVGLVITIKTMMALQCENPEFSNTAQRLKKTLMSIPHLNTLAEKMLAATL